ncbi:hypothetical protein L2E82_27979 [Cichorium intybus]|uniref:Uncharacterized protein n=1 Tax=Cichorium intybus TaxID=13427 RepID=A0ACB9CUS6_CICIN|nr:hypothetical protein L2E82_27979 [Cichorium intybus]
MALMWLEFERVKKKQRCKGNHSLFSPVFSNSSTPDREKGDLKHKQVIISGKLLLEFGFCFLKSKISVTRIGYKIAEVSASFELLWGFLIVALSLLHFTNDI